MVSVRVLGALALIGAACALPDGNSLIQKSADLVEKEGTALEFGEEGASALEAAEKQEEEAGAGAQLDVETGLLLGTGPDTEILAKADLNLDDEGTLNLMLQMVRALKNDINAALSIGARKLSSKVVQKDAFIAEGYLLALRSHLDFVKYAKASNYKGQWQKLNVDMPAFRSFVSRIKKDIYSLPADAVASIATPKGELCMDGPAVYMRRVLSTLKKSPLQYGWTGSELKASSCQSRDFPVSVPNSDSAECFKRAAVWTKAGDEKMKLYNTFSKRATKMWMAHTRKSSRDAYEELNFHMCLDD